MPQRRKMNSPKNLDPGDLLWIPAGSRLVSVRKNFSYSHERPSVGIYIESANAFAWKNWLKVLWDGELYLINKDKVRKIEKDTDLRGLKC